MKIAVASEGENVAQHFGHCESFTIYSIDNKQIISRETVASPGHRPGFLPIFLNDKGVNVVIAGGMGAGAIDLFNEKRIEVVTGALGDVEANVISYLQGALKSSGTVCQEHQHHSDCGGHDH